MHAYNIIISIIIIENIKKSWALMSAGEDSQARLKIIRGKNFTVAQWNFKCIYIISWPTRMGHIIEPVKLHYYLSAIEHLGSQR
jgi:hypothetical protein